METIYTKRYEACFELYLRFGGRNLSRIEREMRALGYADFNRRILYGRKENGIYKPGWIERYEWRTLLAEPPALAGGAVRNQNSTWLNHGDAAVRSDTPRSLYETRPPAHAGGSAFQSWLKAVSPEMTWDWKYQKYIYKYLQRVTDGTCKRLMIFLPPRHGKSELVTVRYAGWRLRQDPKMRVIVSSYNQKLADKFSRSIRRLLSEEEDALKAEPPAPLLPEEGWTRFADGVVGAAGGGAAARKATPNADREPGCPHDCTNTKSSRNESQPPADAGGSAAPTRMFPPSRTVNTVSQWETALGGGVKAVGVGAGVTGFGAQLVVIDDPVKSRAEAESETYREKLWDWYNNDLYTRLEPNASVILIQTRWHQDDLAGRLLREMHDGGDKWEVINLPALSEPGAAAAGSIFTAETQRRGEEEDQNEQPNDGIESRQPPETSNPPNSSPLRLCVSAVNAFADPLGRMPGAALCPERFDETALDNIRRQLGSYSFSALYQQQPTPAEGGIFKRAWFKRIVDKAPDGLQWKRGYDLAVSTRTSSCFTASFRVAIDKATGNMYIADGFRQRIEFPEQRRYIISRIKQEKDTEHGIEKALHGQALIQDLRRETAMHGRALRGVDVTTDKVTSALKWAPLAEEGKIILVRGAWNREFLDEVCQFPTGQFDDQIDAVSLAVTMFDDKGRKMWRF